MNLLETINVTLTTQKIQSCRDYRKAKARCSLYIASTYARSVLGDINTLDSMSSPASGQANGFFNWLEENPWLLG